MKITDIELEITVKKADPEHLKSKPEHTELGFGNFFTDHMFIMTWSKADGWHNARIQPYQNFSIDPAAMVFHYGQAIFEGLKAYRAPNGETLLFRAGDNFKRMNRSAIRMCMPRVPVQRMLQVIKALIYLDRDWVPSGEGATLYLRPTMIASEPSLGLRPSENYLFFILASPVGAYYSEGFNPVKIFVEDKYVRAVQGGVGEAKTAGNYAASVKALTEAQQKGYSQVLWLDAIKHKYIEEVGTSNVFFVIDDELITPPLAGTILPGITRDSVIRLARDWGLKVSERPVSIDEVIETAENGKLQESFSTGTAAVISPLGELVYQGKTITVNNGETGKISKKLFDELQNIQFGRQEDTHGWTLRIA